MLKKLGMVMVLLASALMLLGADKQTREQENCPHDSWENGVCTVCGAEPTFYEEHLPDKYYKQCPCAGEIREMTYSTRLYYADNKKPYISRKVQIYVPYGYSAETKYNVMVLVPGLSFGLHLWLDYANDPYHPGTKGRDIVDNLIYYGDIAPTILVVVNGPDGGYVDRWAFQLASELKYDLLPMICSEFSTYAEEPVPEKIEAARKHFGIGGCSNGGVYAYSIGLLYAKELFGNVMALSPISVSKEVVNEVAQGDDTYELNMLFIGAGNREGNTKRSRDEYDLLLASCPWLEEGRNAFYRTVVGGHTWWTWRTLLANALPLMF